MSSSSASSTIWRKGQIVWIEVDQSLGPTRIVDDSDPSFFELQGLETGELRHYTKRNPPFRRANLEVGQKLRVRQLEVDLTLLRVETRDGLFFFESAEGCFSEADVSALLGGLGVQELIRQKKFSHPKLFALRRDARTLLEKRRHHPMRGAAGCRVQLLPHQLWVLKSCLEMTRVRALLADEVGLGKTIEAGLVFSALHARQKLKKVLVLVPPALKVQWLTESFRRFNIRFRLDHEELIDEDEFRDFVIASLDEVVLNQADFDLLIVDEAHRLVHDTSRADDLARLVARAEHVLFLSATPRVHGDSEFRRMMDILGQSSEGRILPRVFQSRREDLGLPCFRSLEAALVPDKKRWLFDFVANFLMERQQEKLFLISSQADDVIDLHKELRRRLGENFALFHEGMDLVERDRQAAYFADPEGARVLVSSEIGGEGRNFQFCHNMVLLDLPRDPLIVEQRIGRLDRLGQSRRVHVWCPVLIESPEELIFETLRDRYRVFEKPWSGSGFEDLSDGELTSCVAVFQSLESLRGSSAFDMPVYDPTHAAALLGSAADLAETPIREFLDRLYDLFGIEVEDFDSRGNWKVAVSSLMFVEHFPGLGDTDERVLSFDRVEALAREDLSFFSIDHPDVVESIEFLLNSDHGRLAITSLPEGVKPDILLWGLVESLEKGEAHEELWSCSEARRIKVSETLLRASEPISIQALSDPALLRALSAAFVNFSDALGGRAFDSLLILLPEVSVSNSRV